MEYVPEVLNYSTIKPPGIPSHITRQRYNPSSPASQIRPFEFCRFEINSTGFLDPYLGYMNIDVDFSTLDDHVIAQVDGSAHSAFKSMTITSRGVEIERIMEYDLLANALSDIHFPMHKRYTRSLEGLGYANYSNMTWGKAEGGLSATARKVMMGSNLLYNTATGVTAVSPWMNHYVTSDLTSATNPNPVNIGTLGPNYISDTMMYVSPEYPAGGTCDDINVVSTTTALMPGWSTGYQTRYGVQPQFVPAGFKLKSNGAGGFIIDPAADYRLEVVSKLTGTDVTFGTGTNVGRALVNQNGSMGIDLMTDSEVAKGATRLQMFNYALSNANFEPQFTNGKLGYYNPASPAPTPGSETNLVYYMPGTQPSGWLLADKALQYSRPVITSGKFARSAVSIGSFSIPLMSGVFGVLMPKSAYKLIPMSAFPNTVLEFQISPYLIFTSGYCNSDLNSVNYQPARKFTISRIEFISDQYLFTPEVEAIILGPYRKGDTIYIHTHSFLLGPTQQITANVIPSSVQLGLGFESLKAIAWMFIPQDHTTYSYCRRQFRLSHCLTRVQAKINMDYFPTTPSLTNGGNLAPLMQSTNLGWQRPNNEYWIDLMKAWGKYNDRTEDTWISPQNFAVNDRAFCPDNFKTQTAPDRNGKAYTACDCQYGWPLIHENRVRGCAIYAIDLETLTNEPRVLSGVNTTLFKTEIQMEYQGDATATFKGLSIMYPFCWYDFVIAVSAGGINVVGRS